MSQENMADRQRKAEAEQRREEKKRLTIEECMRTAKVERPQIQLLPSGPMVGTPPLLKVRFWLNDIRYVGNVLAFIGDEEGNPTAVIHIIEHDDITLRPNVGNSPWPMSESHLAERRLEAAERIGTLTYSLLTRHLNPVAYVVKVVS